MVSIPFTDNFNGSIDPGWVETDTAGVLNTTGYQTFNKRIWFERDGAPNVWGNPGLVLDSDGLARSSLGAFCVLVRLTNYADQGPRIALSPSLTDSGAAGANGVTYLYPEFWAGPLTAQHKIDITARPGSIDYLIQVIPRVGGGYFMFISGGVFGTFPTATLVHVSKTGSDANIYGHIAGRTSRFLADYAKALGTGSLPAGFTTRYGGALTADTFNRTTLGTTAEFGGQTYTVFGSTLTITGNQLDSTNTVSPWDGLMVNPGATPVGIVRATINTTTGGRGVELIVRGNGTQSSGIAFHADNLVTGFFRLDNGGVLTQTGAWHIENGTTHEFILYDYGDRLVGYLDGNVQSVDTTLFNTQNQVGITINGGMLLDEWAVWPRTVTLHSDSGPFSDIPIGTGSAVFSDAFTLADGTALAGQNGWLSTGAGTWQVNGNKARMSTASTNGVLYRSVAGVGNDHEVKATITLPGVTSPYPNDFFTALFARYTPGGDQIMARYLYQEVAGAGNPEVELWQISGGVSSLINYVQLGTGAIVAGGSYTLTLAVKGNEVCVYHNGVPVVQATTDVATGTNAGIGVADNNPFGQPSWDDFQVRPTSVTTQGTRQVATSAAVSLANRTRQASASAALRRTSTRTVGTSASVSTGATIRTIVALAAVAYDTTPPEISNVQAEVLSTTSVRVSWETDEASVLDTVQYGLTTAYGSQRSVSGSLGVLHSITVDGLLPGETYHFLVISQDASGNNGVSTDDTFTVTTGVLLEDFPDTAYERMRAWLPPFYSKRPGVIDEVLIAQGQEIDLLNEAIAESLNQAFARTATWTLDIWEFDLGLAPIPGFTTSQRQDRIVSKLRGTGTATLPVVLAVAEAYEQGEISVVEDFRGYTVRISFVDTRGLPTSIIDLQRALREIVPAHLDITYEFTYLRWDEVDTASVTWADMDYMNRTWSVWEVSKTFEHAPGGFTSQSRTVAANFAVRKTNTRQVAATSFFVIPLQRQIAASISLTTPTLSRQASTSASFSLVGARRQVAATAGLGSGSSPDTITGLRFWHDSTFITGLLNNDPVSIYPDRTGHGFDALQPATSRRFTYLTNLLGTNPGLRMDGVDDGMSTGYTEALGDFTAFVVFRDHPAITNHERLMDKSYTNGFWIGRDASNPDAWGGGVLQGSPPYGSFVTLPDGTAHIIVMRRQGTTLTIRGDRTEVITATVSGAATDTSEVWLGCDQTGAAPGGADTFDDGLYNRALSDEEIAGLEDWASLKHGISLGGPMGLSAQEEFNGPFASWRNVVTADSADPTGVADSSTAIENAILSGANTIYFPAGTYRITRTLTTKRAVYNPTTGTWTLYNEGDPLGAGGERVTLAGRRGIRFVGHDPLDTTILWDGPVGTDTTTGPVLVPMIRTDGVSYSSISRLTFDGQAKLGSVAVEQAWTNGGAIPDTANEYVDCIFNDLACGVRVGTRGYMGSEVNFRRCEFNNSTRLGIGTYNYNALDVWVDDCVFDSCYIALTNEGHERGNAPPAGNYHARRCVTRNSTWSAYSFCNTSQNFHFLDCVSYQDNSFLNACEIGANGAGIVIQRCQILDPVLNDRPERPSNFTIKSWKACIEIGNPGPLVIMDSTFRMSASWTPGSVIHLAEAFTGAPTGDVTLVGNTFSTSAYLGVQGDSLQIPATQNVVDRSLIPTPERATAVASHAPLVNRAVFEPSSTSTTAIQTAINDAHANGDRSVVHIPAGEYNVTAGLTVPANSDIQIVGDGFDDGGTLLHWVGSPGGTWVMTVNGPSRVALRDFQIHGDIFAAHGTGNGLRILNCDQAGSRIHGVGVLAGDQGNTEAAIEVNSIDNAVVRLDACGFGPSEDASRGTYGIRHVGGSGLAVQGATGTGGIYLLGVACGGQGEVYDVQSGGQIIATAGWWENGTWYTFLNADAKGKLHFVCYNIQPAHTYGNDWENSGGTSGGRDQPDIIVDNFNGDIAEVGVSHAGPYLARRRIQGTGTNARYLMLSNMHQGHRDDKPWASQDTQIENTSPSTKFVMAQAKGTSHDGWLYNLADINTNVASGTPRETFIVDLLARIRNDLPSSPPAGFSGAPAWQQIPSVPTGATDVWLNRVHVHSAWIPIWIAPS